MSLELYTGRGFRFISPQDYRKCLRTGDYTQFVRMFWKIIFQLKPEMGQYQKLKCGKRDLKQMFMAVSTHEALNGWYSQSNPEYQKEKELLEKMRGKPSRSFSATELLIYPFGYTRIGGFRKYIEIYLDEIRSFLHDRKAEVPKPFNHHRKSNEDIDRLIADAENNLQRLRNQKVIKDKRAAVDQAVREAYLADEEVERKKYRH